MNEEQFNQLYNKYESYVGYLLRNIYNYEDRLDLSQEVGIIVGQKLDNIEEGKERSFIKTVTFNRIGNYISKEEGRKNMMNKMEMITKVVDEDDDIAYFNLMDYLENNLEDWEVQFIMYFIQGITQQELAKHLDRPQSWVSHKMQQAIAHAREVLDDDYEINAVTSNSEHNNWVKAAKLW